MDKQLVLHTIDELMRQLRDAINQADWHKAESIATKLAITLPMLD